MYRPARYRCARRAERANTSERTGRAVLQVLGQPRGKGRVGLAYRAAPPACDTIVWLRVRQSGNRACHCATACSQNPGSLSLAKTTALEAHLRAAPLMPANSPRHGRVKVTLACTWPGSSSRLQSIPDSYRSAMSLRRHYRRSDRTSVRLPPRSVHPCSTFTTRPHHIPPRPPLTLQHQSTITHKTSCTSSVPPS